MMRVRVITAAVGLAFAAMAFVHAQPAEAKSKYHHVKVHHTIRGSAPIISQLSAKRHSYRHAGGGGSCDGFTRCRCGTTTARYHGLPYNYNGMNLKMARAYYGFPRTSFGVGAVGVAPHHVLTVTGGSDCAHAMVHDDAGDYQRNVCNMTFVSVGGGGYTQTASAAPHRHSRRHRGAEYAENSYTSIEPQAIH